jgi:PAS domain S-box-containing protein
MKKPSKAYPRVRGNREASPKDERRGEIARKGEPNIRKNSGGVNLENRKCLGDQPRPRKGLSSIRGLERLWRDLDKMNRIEQSLRLSEEKYSKIFKSCPVWLAITARKDGRYLEVNNNFLKIIGFKRSEVIGKTSVELGIWPRPSDRARIINLLRKAGRLKNEEIIFNTKAGEPLNCLLSIEPIEIGGKPFLISTALDITEQKRMENLILASEERFRTLARISPVGIFRTDARGRCLYINERWTDITSLSLQETTGKQWTHFLNPQDKKRIEREWKQIVTRGGFLNAEYRFGLQPGRVTWVLVNIIPEKNGSGDILGYVGTITDITPLKRSEEALREAEGKYRDIFENATEGIYQTTPDGRLLNANQAAADIMGYKRTEDLIKNFNDVGNQVYLDPNDRAQTIVRLRKNGYLKNHEVRWRHKEGFPVWVSLSTRIVRDTRGKALYFEGTCRNITLRKKAQEELKGSEEKMRFLSNQLILAQERERKRIAMELHDELGQSLIGLKLQLSGLSKRGGEDRKVLGQEINQGLKQIDGMTRNIRRITQDLHPTILEHLGLVEALRWLCDQLAKRFKIQFVNGLRETFGSTFSKEQELIIFRIFQEAFNNIRKHARAKRVSILITALGKNAIFSIRDDGQGFDLMTVMNRSPFQIGLGLTSMGERARMAGGSLSIQSKPGEGTAIILKVPFQNK